VGLAILNMAGVNLNMFPYLAAPGLVREDGAEERK
jgi:hypothetical protein